MKLIKLEINTSNMMYNLSVSEATTEHLNVFPEFKMEGDTVIAYGNLFGNNNTLYDLFESQIRRLKFMKTFSNVLSGSLVQCYTMYTYKALDASLCASILSLSDYKRLISKMEKVSHYVSNKLIKINSLGNYNECEINPTSQHLPIFDSSNNIIGYFENNSLYFKKCDNMDERVSDVISFVEHSGIDVSTPSSYKEYMWELKERFSQALMD